MRTRTTSGGCSFCFRSSSISAFTDSGVNSLRLSASSRKRITILADCKFLSKHVHKSLACSSLLFSFASSSSLSFAAAAAARFAFAMMASSSTIFARASTSFKPPPPSARSARKRPTSAASSFADPTDSSFATARTFTSLARWANFSVDIVSSTFTCAGETHARSVQRARPPSASLSKNVNLESR